MAFRPSGTVGKSGEEKEEKEEMMRTQVSAVVAKGKEKLERGVGHSRLTTVSSY